LSATGPKPRSAQMHSACVAHAHGVGSAHVHSAAHTRAITAVGRASRRSRQRCHSGGGGANGGGRAPTTVRLPARHGEGENSSPELLVDGEGEQTSLAAAFFRRGGATVVGCGPAMGRREGEVSSTLHGWKTTRGGLRRRSPWTNLATAETAGQRRPSDTDGGVASDSGGGAVGTERGEARRVRQPVVTRPVGTGRRCQDAGARSRQCI
jgi:hypothetical protein